MVPASSADIEGNTAAQLLQENPAELKRRVSELKEENVILSKRLQEALRESARLSATYRERQWAFLSRRDPELCSTLGPRSDLGAYLLLKMQATGEQLAAQIKEVNERAERMEAETVSSRLQLEAEDDQAEAFEEDVRRYSAEAAALHRRWRDASAALAAERRHRQLLCERLRDADWALDLLLHDASTRLLAADMLDAGPEGAVRIHLMQEQVALLESQLRPAELSSPDSVSESKLRRAEASRRMVAERELRVLDYEEGQGQARAAARPGGRSSSGSDGGGGAGDGSGVGDGGEREGRAANKLRRRRSRSGDLRDRAAAMQRLAQEMEEQQLRTRQQARRLAVLREEAEDLRLAVDKMRKSLGKLRQYDSQLVERVEESLELVSRAEGQHESQVRLLRRFTLARQRASATFVSALRNSHRRHSTLQSALRHSQQHLRVLHNILQHFHPAGEAPLSAHFYHGLVEASEKERDVLMERMAQLAFKLCRAKGRAQADWQSLVAVRSHIQDVEAQLRPYGITVTKDRKPQADWTAIRERQLERELVELQEMGRKFHEAAVRAEVRYLRDMWALHHLFLLAVSRMEPQSASSQQAAATGEPEAPGGEGHEPAEEVEGAQEAEEAAPVRRKCKRRACRAKGASQRPPKGKPRKKGKKPRESDESLPLPAVRVGGTCEAEMPRCGCTHNCLQLPDTPCTSLRNLTLAAGSDASSRTYFE